MTRDDIIRMAREAGMAEFQEVMYNNFWTADQKELERFAALVAAAEREACAKICDEFCYGSTKILVEKAIRERGQA